MKSLDPLNSTTDYSSTFGLQSGASNNSATRWQDALNEAGLGAVRASEGMGLGGAVASTPASSQAPVSQQSSIKPAPYRVDEKATTATGPANGLAVAGKSVLIANPEFQFYWENTISAWTGKSGFSGPLQEELQNRGFVYTNPGNPNAPPPGSLDKSSGVPLAQANPENGRIAEQAIEDRYRAQGYEVGTQIEMQTPDGGRRWDIAARIPAKDPRDDVLKVTESKLGYVSREDGTLEQLDKDDWLGKINDDRRDVGRMADTTGKVLRPVAGVLDAVELGQAFHADGNRIGEHTGEAAASIAGGWGGSLALAASGAEFGAGVGPVRPVPVVGTLVGGLVGGVVGGVVGSKAGHDLYDGARKACHWVKSLF